MILTAYHRILPHNIKVVVRIWSRGFCARKIVQTLEERQLRKICLPTKFYIIGKWLQQTVVAQSDYSQLIQVSSDRTPIPFKAIMRI